MLKQLLALTCMHKKDKNKLAITAGTAECSNRSPQNSPGSSSEGAADESLNQSVAIPVIMPIIFSFKILFFRKKLI